MRKLISVEDTARLISSSISRKIGPNFSVYLITRRQLCAPRITCGNVKIHSRIIIESFLIIFLLQILISGSFGTPDASNDFYSLKIDLPPELIYDVTVTDILSDGLVYIPDSLIISGALDAATTIISSPNYSSLPVTIAWNFDRVDNSADQDILIRFKALVADVPSNHEGTVLAPGKACLSWKDKDGRIYSSSAESSSVRIIEPDLEIKRSIKPSPASVGDEVICSFSICHLSPPSSTSNAFDVSLKDVLPDGLTYEPGSTEKLSGPDCVLGDRSWYFPEIDQYWSGDNKIQLRYRATISGEVRSANHATLSWYSAPNNGNLYARDYSKTSDAQITTTSQQPPGLAISMGSNPNPVRPGGKLNYVIGYTNRGGYASSATIHAVYDQNVQFVSAYPSPDLGTNDRWDLGDLRRWDNGTIAIIVQVGPQLADGYGLSSSATITSQNGVSAQATATTGVNSSSPLLLIDKTVDSPVLGGRVYELNYSINYRNKGDSTLTNVYITDIVDKNLASPNDIHPWPSQITHESDGTHLIWNATTLGTLSMNSDASGTIWFKARLPDIAEPSAVDSVYNNYKIDSDQTVGSFNVLETFVIHSLWIKKTTDKEVYSQGEVVNYTITYGNDEQKPLDFNHVLIEDYLPDLNYIDYLSASPEPSSINGNVLLWNIGKLGHGQSGTIQLYVKIKENCSEMRYTSSGFVSGEGFANIRQKLDTAQKPDHLTNYVEISDTILGELHSASATIDLADALGTAVNIRGHGSGNYTREDQTQLIEKNRSIQVKTSLSERYASTSFGLPQGRSIKYSSKWSEAQTGKNRITGATLSEVYMYANRIKRDSTINLDKNGSTLASEISFEGAGHIDIVKKESDNSKIAPTYESHEDYLGSFNVNTSVDEYGKNVVSNRSVSGTGMAASDKRIKKSQRSYESGTGAYQVDDRMETQTNYMAKDMNVSYALVSYAYTPDFHVNLSKKWEEGLWSKSGVSSPKGSNSNEPASLISEQFSGADYLKMNTTARGLNEMDTKAEFSGKAQFKVVKDSNSNKSDEVNLYDLYIGKYKISRKTTIAGVAKYDEPHLTISKVGKAEPAGGRLVSYEITVTNDGNQALEPVYVLDLFPPGTEFVSSSLRPTELASNYSRWTLTNLGIGSISRIDLSLKMTEGTGSLVNQVQVNGGYNNTWVSAENYSALRKGWLSCSLTQLLAAKEAYVDSKDPMLVHYRIFLKNRLNDTMAASVIDQLPGGMEFINSTIVPSYHKPDKIIWNILDLKPGKNITIDYLARALQRGTFVNEAHIDASYLHGEDSVSTDITSSVDIGAGTYSSSISDWQPSSCLGLNCTEQGSGDDWMPCESCGATEPQPILQPSPDSSCPSCPSSADAGGGYDIP